MSSTRRSPGSKLTQKKRLSGTDPRRNPRTESRSSSGKTGRVKPDPVTISLGAIAIILLILVIVFIGRGPVRSSSPDRENTMPVIERVETDPAVTTQDTVVELGVPENPEDITDTALPEDPIETEENAETTARLFFVKVSDEGKISLKSVLRPVPATGSPLTQSIRALIVGPRPGEISNDVLSLVPEGSILIGARVEGGIAFLDFNEQFRFNALGIEGYQAQVEQIVYTATEFSTVEKVQILIEGQRIDYLGGEGFWVGAPLGREDF